MGGVQVSVLADIFTGCVNLNLMGREKICVEGAKVYGSGGSTFSHRKKSAQLVDARLLLVFCSTTLPSVHRDVN